MSRRNKRVPFAWTWNVHWTEKLKAFSPVMLSKIKGAPVIDACCGETHRHTTLKDTRQHDHTIHDASSAVRSGEPRLFPLQCWVCHRLASSDAFSSVSLLNTVVVFSVGFSSVLALAFMFETWPRPCTACSGKCPCEVSGVFLRFLLERPSLPFLQVVNIC